MSARGGRSLRRGPLAAAAAAVLATAALLGGAAASGSGSATASRVGPYPSLGKCHVFPDPPASLPARARSLPNEAAWNQDISKAPVAKNSRAVIAYINSHGANSLHPDFGSPRGYGFPYSVVGAHQRELPIHYTAYGSQSDRGPFPIPSRAPVEGGQHSNDDRHVLVIDRSDCVLYDLGRAFFKRRGRDHYNADAGSRWNLRSKRRRPDTWTSADAAGLPIFPGLVRFDEARSGHIDHAIRVTFDSTRNAWVHPGSHCAGDTSRAAAPPMGMRLRLNPHYRLGHFTGPAKVIARALKRYGMLVADNGSNWYISGTSDHRWNDENLNQLKRIPGRAFQVVKSAARVHVC